MIDKNPLVRRLRAVGLRPTPTRIAVLELLAGTPDSLRVDDVYLRLIKRGIHINVSAIYHSLKEMLDAGLLLCFWDTHRAMRYGFLPETAQTPSFHIASRDGEATFSDVELHARLLAVAAREGLELDGHEFTLHVRPGRRERKRETGRDQRSRQERTSQ